MISKLKIIFWLLLPFWSTYFLSLPEKSVNQKEKQHVIQIHHPGEKELVEATLIEVQNSEGLAIQYHMDVESVICLEQVCKVIPVTLFWNNLGTYQNYKLQQGATLEKYEADLFEPADYKKLNQILKNPDSPFKEVYIDEILTVTNDPDGEVDAYSGETILELDEEDTVPGAALTCYTLWHWANGEIESIIKRKTGESATADQLQSLINDDNSSYFKIALNELDRRQLFSKVIVDSIIKVVLADPKLIPTASTYFKNSPEDLYFYAIENLFFRGEKIHKLTAINSLLQTEFHISDAYLDQFSQEIQKLSSFQEVSLLLDLMDAKNPNSKVVIANTFPLLEENLLIARRAYWFLSNQELDENQNKVLKEFQKRNQDKL